jgi:integrase
VTVASVKRRGEKWEVRWRRRVGTTAEGKPIWRWRSRTAPTRRAADAVARQVEEAKAVGREWIPDDELQVADLVKVYEAYLEHLVRLGRSDSTFAAVGVAVDALWEQLGHRPGRPLPVTLMSRDALIGTWDRVRANTSPETATKRIRSLEQFWRWAHEVEYVGVPAPRRLPDLPRQRPVWAASPTWAEVDAVIRWLIEHRGGWRRDARACWIARCQGLRMSSVVALRWRDVDLEAGMLRVPANHPGVKTALARQGWTTPIAPPLLESLREWGGAGGELLVGSRHDAGLTNLRKWVRRGWEVQTEAELVRREVWDPPGRKQGRPLHVFRAAWKSGLSAAGVRYEVRQAMIGGDRGVEGASYVSADALPLHAAAGRVPVLQALPPNPEDVQCKRTPPR